MCKTHSAYLNIKHILIAWKAIGQVIYFYPLTKCYSITTYIYCMVYMTFKANAMTFHRVRA